jgi:hypothetical protein
MNTLHLYGCSHGLLLTNGSLKKGIWVTENTFGDILAKQLNLLFVNKCAPGNCNFNIFSKVLSDLSNDAIDKDDIVLVQWSHIGRTWVNDDDTEWNIQHSIIMPHHVDEVGTTKSKLAKIFYRSFYNDFQCFSNMLGWNQTLKDIVGCKYYWSTSERFTVFDSTHKFLYDKMRLDPTLIASSHQSPLERMYNLNDKENIFPCWHATPKGHKLIAEYYYQEMSKNLEM